MVHIRSSLCQTTIRGQLQHFGHQPGFLRLVNQCLGAMWEGVKSGWDLVERSWQEWSDTLCDGHVFSSSISIPGNVLFVQSVPMRKCFLRGIHQLDHSAVIRESSVSSHIPGMKSTFQGVNMPAHSKVCLLEI